MIDEHDATEGLGDAEILALEKKLREDFYRAEQAAMRPGETRPPAVQESPELLKAFDRWSRVSTAARRKGLGDEVTGER
jgi:hypothetical protein